MQTVLNKSSSTLLPPTSSDAFSKAVPDLIHFFEGLDTTIEESSSPSIDMSRIPQSFPSPFSALRLSLTTTFNNPRKMHTSQTSTDSTTSSASASPQSSFRGGPFARSRTWNTNTTSTRTRSRSPRSMHSYTNSPVCLSRRPSATDLALLEEESLSHNVKTVGLGLDMMEPRPVVPVAIAATGSTSIFEGEEEVEHKEPFVMGGILEVMEGRS